MDSVERKYLAFVKINKQAIDSEIICSQFALQQMNFSLFIAALSLIGVASSFNLNRFLHLQHVEGIANCTFCRA